MSWKICPVIVDGTLVAHVQTMFFLLSTKRSSEAPAQVIYCFKLHEHDRAIEGSFVLFVALLVLLESASSPDITQTCGNHVGYRLQPKKGGF